MRLLLLLAAVALVAGCGGGDEGDERRQALATYLRDANIQLQGAASALAGAEAALRDFSLEGEAAARSAEQLEEVEATMTDVRGRLADLEPPPEARTLHRQTLDLLDRQQALARDLGGLAQYLPRAAAMLAAGNDDRIELQESLRESTTAAEQATAARRFAKEAGATIAEFERLEPAVLLEEWHSDQLTVLRDTRRHSLALADALESGDAAGVDRALAGFERVSAATSAAVRAQAVAIRAFNARVLAQRTLAQRIRREQGRLDRTIR